MGEPVQKMRPLTAADISGARDLKLEPMHIPEWGGTVYVRELADGDSIEYFARFSGKNQKVDHDDIYRVVAMALCDENGERLYDDVGGPEQLRRRKFTTVLSVFNKAMVLSGLTKAAIDIEKKD